MSPFQELNQVLENLATVRGVSTVDLLNLPEVVGHTLGVMVRRQGMNLQEFAEEVGLSEAEAQSLLDILVKKGYISREIQSGSDTARFRLCFARMRTHPLSLDF